VTQIADPISALIAYLKADVALAAKVNNRVYAGELPEGRIASMPEQSVLIRTSGGGLLPQSYLQIHDVRVDIICYGQTPYAAFDSWRCVHGALKQMYRNVQGSTVLHWALTSGGPLTERQQDTEWPLVLSSWQVMFDERNAA
jgi:hypothetical protein